MKFSTPVTLPECPFRLTPSSKVMMIGSCFTEHIGERMAQGMSAARLCVNPNGVLYNPGSILLTLEDLLKEEDEHLMDGAFQATDGLWHHWSYSTLFTASSSDELKRKLLVNRERAKAVFDETDVLFVTLSTDHAYYLGLEEGKRTLVANCHKQPARLFTEEVLNSEALRKGWKCFLEAFQTFRPGVQVVFTLSPYRYAKYGMHENALSKARLLLLIDELCREFADVCYFPAYEIVLDELRDYRFFDSDMLHPSAQATDYVWERFSEWAFSEDFRDYVHDRQAIARDRNHRPLNPESEDFQKFRMKAAERRKLFEQKWGEVPD